MPIIHSLVGYDSQTDRMVARFDIPDHLMPDAKKIAKVPADDPDAAWSYPLTEAKTRRIARLIGVRADPGEADFFWRLSPTPPDRSERVPQRADLLPLARVGQAAEPGREIVLDVLGAAGRRDHAGDGRLGENVFEDKLRPARAVEFARPFG
jgi:hypothetical protein